MSFAKFDILTAPKGKERPRVSNKKFYKQQQTIDFENLIKYSFMKSDYKNIYFDANIPLEIKIKAFFKKPQYMSKEIKQKFACGKIFPTKKPDSDNISKLILDALNKVAFHDDKQVVKLNVEKVYDDIPRMEVEICEAK